MIFPEILIRRFWLKNSDKFKDKLTRTKNDSIIAKSYLNTFRFFWLSRSLNR